MTADHEPDPGSDQHPEATAHEAAGPAAGTPDPRPAEVRHQRPPALTPAQVLPLLVVLVGLIAGMVLVGFGQWRIGCLVVGGFVAIGGIERLVLPRERAGLLQARSRFFDVIALFGMAIAIIVLALVIPPNLISRLFR